MGDLLKWVDLNNLYRLGGVRMTEWHEITIRDLLERVDLLN
jgi:hypothetical protein